MRRRGQGKYRSGAGGIASGRGQRVVDVAGDYALAYGVALQGTQMIVAGQRASGSEIEDFVARLRVDLLFADGFE